MPTARNRHEPSDERRPTFKVSVVLPCLNEADHIGECVDRAWQAIRDGGWPGEVIVSDNGSTDQSATNAAAAGAHVVHESRRGYGNAYLAGFAAARGDIIIMLDGDLTYPFEKIPEFVARLDEGADLVIGNRMDNIEPGAMPVFNRKLGNPALSTLNRRFGMEVKDTQCGMRAFRRDLLPHLALQTSGMEFASEMLINAHRERLQIEQIEIVYSRRKGEAKLKPIQDGARHLVYMLGNCPTLPFLRTGQFLTAFSGVAIAGSLVGGSGIHAVIAICLLMTIGVQVVTLSICARHQKGELRPFNSVALIRIEHLLLLGLVIALVGIVGGTVVAILSVTSGAQPDPRLPLVAATLVVIGLQIFFVSFLLAIVSPRPVRPPADAPDESGGDY